MLPAELQGSLLVSAGRLAEDVARLGGPAGGAGALVGFLTALGTRLYSLMVQHAPAGGAVRFVTDGEDLQVRCEVGGEEQGVSVSSLARAVMFTPDGALSGPFQEHLLNRDDASAAAAWLARHAPTEALTGQVVWLQWRELSLRLEGVGALDAVALAQQELLEREGGVWLARGAGGEEVQLRRAGRHRA